jgi:two-component system OmpR family response regulator
VLIVEDDPSARRALSRILRKQGYVVCEAACLADAYREMEQQVPCWILLDLMLPDGCGMDLMRGIRASGLSCKVCVITGCGAQKIAEVRTLEPEHIFTKPVDLEGLLFALGSVHA